MSFKIDVVPVGPVYANCIILLSVATKSLMIVDPGGNPEKIVQHIKDLAGNEINYSEYSISLVLTHARK